jgi:hypothetical protein
MRMRWVVLIIVAGLLAVSVALIVRATVVEANAGSHTPSSACRVALVISREEAETAHVDWSEAMQEQAQWAGTYPCGNEGAKTALLKRLTEEKQAFLHQR